MNNQITQIGQIEHAATGLTIEVIEHAGKRPIYTASILGMDFKNSKREKLDQQVNAALDQVAALTWQPVIEAYTRYTPFGASFLSVDRYWILQLPAGDLLRANWRAEEDDQRARLQRAYIANLPPGFGELPFLEKGPERQRAWMPYSDTAWNGFQQSVGRLRLMAASPAEPVAPSSMPTVFVPPHISRFEIHYKQLEKLIKDYLEIDYPILSGERWTPEGSNVLSVSMDGYDDSDRAVVEQIRNGERCYFALEMLMRVLVEKHVIPEGNYLVTARQE